MTDGRTKLPQALDVVGRGAPKRYDLMPIDEARAELARMPVVLAAEVCRNSVGCGDEMVLLPLLPPETAVDLMFTDLTLFGKPDGLHLFQQMVVRGLAEDKVDAELAERVVTITTTSGKTVTVPIVIDTERAKLYVMTVIGMNVEARKELYRCMDPTGERGLFNGEKVFIDLVAFVICAMNDGDIEHDEEFFERLTDFDEGLLEDAISCSTHVERVALEQDLLEPHVEAMARHFAVVADLFEQHGDKGVDDIIGDIEF